MTIEDLDVYEGDWDDEVEYPRGSYIRHNGSYYLSRTVEIGTEPGVEGSWTEVVPMPDPE